jgi:heptosyltransferase-3
MELQNVRRLAVFKLRNIGDVLMATPVLRALREKFPAARISVIVNSGTEAMLAGNPHVDEVLVYRRKDAARGIVRRLVDEIQFVRDLRRRRFDLTISFTEGDRAAWYSLACGAPVRIGFVKGKAHPRAYTHRVHAPRGMRLHEVEKHFQLLREAGLPLPPPGPLCLELPDHVRAWAHAELATLRPAHVVHVHPVSRWLWKCWDSRAMAEVIDWLQTERHTRVIVTTGPAPRELEHAREIVALCRTAPLFYPGNLSLTQIAALSAESDGYFGVDTAPMHMAAAVGAPVVALFGPTSEKNWGPWTPRGQVLSSYCVCRDSNKSEKCDWNRVRACLAAISVAQAQGALDRMLELPKTAAISSP